MNRLRVPTPRIATITLLGLLLLQLSLGAQTIVLRDVVAGGGGTTGNGTHMVRGTLSQTAVGRLTHGAAAARHDVGFWYWAYKVGAVTTVSLPEIETNTATKIRVALSVEGSEPTFPFLPRPFTARIRFNHTLLHPIEATPACTYDGNDCVIEISGVATTLNGILAELDFITALGDAESTPLEIVDFQWEQTGDRNRVVVTKRHGSLTLLDVCRVDGEIRLVHSASAARLAVYPNPARDAARIDFTAGEAGPVEIRLVDLLGTTVTSVRHEAVEPNRLYTADLELGSMPSGAYMIVVTTASGRLTERFMIEK